MKTKIKPYIIPAGLALFLLSLYLYGNIRGFRYCNCKSTENWQPGQDKAAGRSSSGRTHFYHK